MSRTRYFKCSCEHCRGHIEYPVDAVDAVIPCPHCGADTHLTLPALASSGLAGEKPPGKGLLLAIIITVIVVGIAMAVLAGVLKHLEAKKAARAQSSTQPPRTPPAPATQETPSMFITNGFTFSPLTIEKTRGSSLIYAVGTVQNDTDRPRHSVTVEVDLFDDDGQKVGTAKDVTSTIEPRKEWRIKAPVFNARPTKARLAGVHEDE